MNRLKVIIIIFLLTVGIFTVSAENNVFEDYDKSLGGYFSSLSGIGLSYQEWSGKWGLQTAAGLIYFPEDSEGAEFSSISEPDTAELLMYDIGAGVQYRLYESSWSDWFDGCLYLVAGITHFGSIEQTIYYSDTRDSAGNYPLESRSEPRYVPGVSGGFGIGMEFLIFDHFSFPTEIVLSGSWDIDSYLPIEAGVKVLGGFRYRF